MKININKVLNMELYTEEGKKNLVLAAGAIEKMFSFLSKNELETLQDLISGGNEIEVYKIMDAYFFQKK